jgi:hypothetical protein
MDICFKLGIDLKGVKMKDQFSPDTPNGIYVVNLDDSDGPGTHWTLLIKMKGNKYLYCDSFGAPPPQTLLDSLRIDPAKLLFNDQQIQTITAKNCGYYCILFAYYYTKLKTPTKTIKAFLSNFTTDEKENDKVLREIFDKLL